MYFTVCSQTIDVRDKLLLAPYFVAMEIINQSSGYSINLSINVTVEFYESIAVHFYTVSFMNIFVIFLIKL